MWTIKNNFKFLTNAVDDPFQKTIADFNVLGEEYKPDNKQSFILA